MCMMGCDWETEDITAAACFPNTSHRLQMEDNVFGEQSGASVVWMKVISLVQVLSGPETVQIIN